MNQFLVIDQLRALGLPTLEAADFSRFWSSVWVIRHVKEPKQTMTYPDSEARYLDSLDSTHHACLRSATPVKSYATTFFNRFDDMEDTTRFNQVFPSLFCFPIGGRPNPR